MLKAGTVIILANQSGDDNFEPASPIEVSFCINPPKPFISESGAPTDLEFHSSNEFGNQWYLNNSIMPGNISSTILVSEEGAYTVATIVDGCASEISESRMYITTGIEEDPSVQISVYPNPVVDNLQVEIVGNISNGAVLELLDAMGRSLVVREMTEAGTMVFDLHTGGMFLVKVMVNGRVIVKKVLRE